MPRESMFGNEFFFDLLNFYYVDMKSTHYRYVHRELPIRLARRLMDLHQMPYVVVTNPNIMGVYRYYLESFQALKAFPELKTIEDNYGA